MTGRRSGPSWAADLALGARLVFAGGRHGLFRTLLTAVGIGLGVTLLLTSTSITTMLDARSERTAARDDQRVGDQPAPSERSLLVAESDTVFRDRQVRGRLLQADGARPAVPPGLTALPRPGELVVSPALAELLRSPDGALLRPRLDHPIVGTIADAGLSGPHEYAYYLGTDRLRDGDPGVLRIDRFGVRRDSPGLDAVLTLLVLIASVVMLLPVAVFVAAAVRFGGEARDRRLAALRLVGADAAMTRRVAAGEALVGAVFGLVVGVLLFLPARHLVETFTLAGFSAFTDDLRPDPVLGVLGVLAVPITAVAVAQLALRRIVVEPLGVVRRAAERRRRLWWRLAMPVLGVLLLIPLVGGIDQASGAFNQVQVMAGVLLLLAGSTALLPWLVEVVVRRMRGGPVSWQLAVRRLQLETGSSARLVSGVAVAVAGGIALQMLFTGVQHGYVHATDQDVSRAQVQVLVPGTLTGTDAGQLAARFRAAPGIENVVGVFTTTAAPVAAPTDRGDRPRLLLRIGDCAALREFATLDRCADGDVFHAVDAQSPEQTAPSVSAGGELDVGREGAPDAVRWRLPATLPTVAVRDDPGGGRASAVLATPGAVDLPALRGLEATVFLNLDTGSDSIEQARNAAAGVDLGARVQTLQAFQESERFGQIRRGLYVGVTATLLLLGASLLVGILDQLRERRRTFAALVAFGTRRRVLGWSVLWQTAVPVLLGLGLALALGTALGATLLAMVGEPVRLVWADVVGMCALAAGVVLLVTGASLPVLWRMLRFGHLRTE
ncbi:FtsX-like permease family protein [Micromonospora krabiensis]|uniref:FtsX-like permease family protein n=1 Tax=Micromonospora krabiensis TaxID=307121 RepID=A0A1C3MXR6_9ACTN|nr:ABC transporter permease [Micromonospora krabiensis]SBV25127.1 FtsX-like permease family protein [Micromonospora krabiensis]